jgi:hypothetical protein
MPDQAARTIDYRVQAPAVATAGNDSSNPVRVIEAGVVSAVNYTPVATITGAATNNRTLNLINKGPTGALSTVVATLNYANAVNTNAWNTQAIALSGTPANLVVAAGDILQWQSLHVGTGITDPGGEAQIVVTRTA